MSKRFHFWRALSIVTVAAAGLCCASSASAQSGAPATRAEALKVGLRRLP